MDATRIAHGCGATERRIPRTFLTLLGTMGIAQNVTYDYDRAANVSAYKKYAWTRGTELTDELNHTRIVRAIEAALDSEGAHAR